ncbi:uncharacterized protein HKW66_Vig0208080 [Vigna angularis]|uniref:Uncharacterized protein n=1 Tax=Phaseolus angularis TaxID=3914 RepID=A0A8T0JK65_PHAAN|nr:uncharacterized protein HKW66_Vig0208080 [Vigna angularis]
MPLSPSSMASIPHLYPNYTFTTHDLSDFPTPHITANASLMENSMWAAQDSFIPVLDINNGALDHIVSLDCDTMACANWMPSFSDQVGGLSDLAISDCKMGFYGGFQNFNARYQPHIGDFGEECCAFLEDVKPPPYPNAARENWGLQGNQIQAVEEPNIKLKNDEEDWLQEAMASLVYLSHSSPEDM